MPRSKYGNTRIRDVETGRIFASVAEYNRYQQLRLLEQSGEIETLICQPRFRLFQKLGKLSAIDYVGDFQYKEKGRVVVEDVKGPMTGVWKLKWNIVQRKFTYIEFRVVMAKDCY